MNKQWERQFAAGWDELYEGQRYARAKYLVEDGIDEGAGIKEVARATERSGHPINQTQVQELLDLYHVAEGTDRSVPLKAGAIRLRHAMQQYETDPDEVAERAAELAEERGYSEGVAERAARAELIGEAMVEEGDITKDGQLRVSDPRTVNPKAGEVRAPRTMPASWDWNTTFERYWGDLNDFLSFLKRTKQDAMCDPVIPRRLLKMAEDFERQADRFEVGVDKHKARKAATSKAGR